MQTIKLINPNQHRILFQRCSKQYLRYFTGSASKHFDIIIAGGGMVGSTLACTLGKNTKLSNKSILLLESNGSKKWKLPEKYSNRVVSLNPGTHKLLNEINAWEFIERCRYATVRHLKVWDAVSDASISFGDLEDDNEVSHIVENDVLIASVANELKNTKNVEVLYNTKVKDYKLPDHENNEINVNLESGNVYSCELLLGCDGTNSLVRKSMRADYLSWNYNQMGVVATLKLSDEITNDTAWQRFLPTGPIALLPLTNNLSSLVWSTTPEQARILLQLPQEDFIDELNKAIWRKYNSHNIVQQATSTFDTLLRLFNLSTEEVQQMPPKICGIEENSRAVFPLGFGHSSQYISKGVALVGDAAHRVHPLAGLGVNLGFGDVACLNSILGEANVSGTALNDMNYLREYENERQKDNVPKMLAIEGLHRIYNTELAPIVLLRSLGLQVTNAIEPLKKAIISQASA